MPVLTGNKIELNISDESTITEASGSRIRPEITPPMSQEIASMPLLRREKILGIREQLAQGTYDLDERLDVVLDRLLVDINT